MNEETTPDPKVLESTDGSALVLTPQMEAFLSCLAQALPDDTDLTPLIDHLIAACVELMNETAADPFALSFVPVEVEEEPAAALALQSSLVDGEALATSPHLLEDLMLRTLACSVAGGSGTERPVAARSVLTLLADTFSRAAATTTSLLVRLEQDPERALGELLGEEEA